MSIAADPVTVQFNASSYMVNETAGSVKLYLTMSPVSSVPVTVSYRTTNGTALAGIDYTAASGNVTFSPGQVNKTISVGVRNDNRYSEMQEFFFVNVTAVTGGAVPGPEPDATIIITETSPRPTVGFNLTNYNVRENASRVEVRVSLSNAATDPITVDYATTDGTAESGDDYLGVAGSLQFDPGERYRTFSVDILDNSLYGGSEVFYVNLTNLAGPGSFGSRQNASITILETSPRPTLC